MSSTPFWISWKHTAADVIRRLIEVTVALEALVVVSPGLLGVGVLIGLDSPGPVLHRARGTSKDGPAITPAGDEPDRVEKLTLLARRCAIITTWI
jgi:lipopolysaccharide/colanic/teichoic acid biosynthesis glycosyltransferase